MADIEWKDEYNSLVVAACEARGKAYAPYSHFAVGAAVMTESLRIFKGCNIENASYPVGICAERVAMSKAISEGEKKFFALCVVGGKDDTAACNFCAPCGLCRQFIREFCGSDFPTITAATDDDGNVINVKIKKLSELLPESFGPENLSK